MTIVFSEVTTAKVEFSRSESSVVIERLEILLVRTIFSKYLTARLETSWENSGRERLALFVLDTHWLWMRGWG